MTYRNLDNLYASSPKAYQELLQFMRSEFEIIQTKLIESLQTGDSAMFGHLRHKLFSTLNTLEHNELKELLTQVKENLVSQNAGAAQEAVGQLNAQFEQLLQSLDDKLMQLEGASVM